MFVSITDIDIKRKIFIETQLSYLIMPRKTRNINVEPKLFPTTNFLCPKNLRAWNLLRKICRDYGYKYLLRQSNNLGWASFIYLVLGIILALSFFGIINLKITTGTSNNSKFDNSLEYIIAFDVAFYLLLLFKELIYGIRLNSFYQLHKNNFEDMRIFLADIARQTDWYFVKGIKPKNHLYRFALKHLKKNNANEDQLSAHLQDILTTMKEIINDLEYEEQQRPFTVLGFAPSYQILSTLGIGVLSLVFAVLQSNWKTPNT